MKFLKALLFVVLANCGSFAQQEPAVVSITDPEFGKVFFTKKAPVIKGKIKNASPEELAGLKVIAHKVSLIGDTQTKEKVQLHNDGTFEITASDPLPYQQIWFEIEKRMHHLLIAHDGLLMEIDLGILKQPGGFQNNEVLRFSGPDSAVCSTMNRYLRFRREKQLDFDLHAMKYKPDERYFAKLDSLLEIRREADQQFVAENGSRFKFLIDNETMSSYLQWKATYYFRYFAENRKDPEAGYDFSEYTKHPIYSISNDSRIFLKYLLYSYRVSRSDRTEEFPDQAKLLTGIDSVFGEDYSGLVMFQIEDPDIKEQKHIFEKGHSLLERDWQKAFLERHLEDISAKADKVDSILVISESKNEKSGMGTFKLGTPFGGHLFVSDKASGKDLIESIRSAYPGKLIVLDIWGTWCAPCLQQMPHSKKLHEEVQKENLPVEFVYLCTSGGSREDKWQNKIVELEQPGTHIYVKEDHIKELFELFKKSGYPSYVVIRPDGSAETNAIRWISDTTLEDLKKLL